MERQNFWGVKESSLLGGRGSRRSSVHLEQRKCFLLQRIGGVGIFLQASKQCGLPTKASEVGR